MLLRLIVKDARAYWYVIASQSLFVIVLMSFGLFVDRNGNMILIAMMMYPIVLPMTMMLMDQKYGMTYVALPVRRNTYVMSKYAGGLLFSMFLLAVGMLYGYCVSTWFVRESINFGGIFSLKGYSALLMPIICFNAIVFPVYFRFSRDKGNLVLMIGMTVFLLALLIGLVVLEKSLETAYGYSQRDVLPYIFSRLSEVLASMGQQKVRLFLGAALGGTVLLSVFSSLFLFGRKDLGGE